MMTTTSLAVKPTLPDETTRLLPPNLPILTLKETRGGEGKGKGKGKHTEGEEEDTHEENEKKSRSSFA